MLVLCSLSDLKKYQRSPFDINFMVVRHLTEPIQGIQWFPKLAPSESLFNFAQRNKEVPGFWEVYHKLYQEELNSHDKQVGLALISDYAKRGKEINLLCYCKDAEKCHRLDLYQALKSMGIECELH